MATKKLTLNELRGLVKQIIKEETMKKPILTPENKLPELDWENGWQALEVELVDEANDLFIEATVNVYVKIEKNADRSNTQKGITIKSNVDSIYYDCFDFKGKRVIDEDDVIYRELEKFIMLEYQK